MRLLEVSRIVAQRSDDMSSPAVKLSVSFLKSRRRVNWYDSVVSLDIRRICEECCVVPVPFRMIGLITGTYDGIMWAVDCLRTMRVCRSADETSRSATRSSNVLTMRYVG